MPANLKARRCSAPPSTWCYRIILTCDNQLAVWFLKDVRREDGVFLGGVPGVCCLYPQAPANYWNLLTTWTPGPGEGVHRLLYKILPYQLVNPPVQPCAGCTCTCALASSKNPSTQGDNVTFTATITDADGSATPQGSVAFYDGATLLGAGSALPASGNPVTSTFAASSLAVGTHTIQAVYTPTSGGGFVGCQSQLSQVVNAATVTVPCCAQPMLQTLHGTFSGGTNDCSCLNGTTVTLTWDGGASQWTGSFSACGGSTTLVLQCQSGTLVGFFANGGACASSSIGLHGTCGGSAPNLTGAFLVHGCCTGNVTLTVTA
jgi:hypothetical protein